MTFTASIGARGPQCAALAVILVTTVLGLIVAIPLVLLHSLVASRSKTLVEILEEQSAGIIARHADGGRQT